MSALILMMLKDETDALEEEIADIFKLLNLPENRHLAVSPQNRAQLKALLRDLLTQLAEQKQKRLKRYMKKWGREKNISREKMKKITDFILSAEFMAFYIADGCLDFVLQACIEKYPRVESAGTHNQKFKFSKLKLLSIEQFLDESKGITSRGDNTV